MTTDSTDTTANKKPSLLKRTFWHVWTGILVILVTVAIVFRALLALTLDLIAIPFIAVAILVCYVVKTMWMDVVGLYEEAVGLKDFLHRLIVGRRILLEKGDSVFNEIRLTTSEKDEPSTSDTEENPTTQVSSSAVNEPITEDASSTQNEKGEYEKDDNQTT